MRWDGTAARISTWWWDHALRHPGTASVAHIVYLCRVQTPCVVLGATQENLARTQIRVYNWFMDYRKMRTGCANCTGCEHYMIFTQNMRVSCTGGGSHVLGGKIQC